MKHTKPDCGLACIDLLCSQVRPLSGPAASTLPILDQPTSFSNSPFANLSLECHLLPDQYRSAIPSKLGYMHETKRVRFAMAQATGRVQASAAISNQLGNGASLGNSSPLPSCWKQPETSRNIMLCISGAAPSTQSNHEKRFTASAACRS